MAVGLLSTLGLTGLTGCSYDEDKDVVVEDYRF